MAFPFDVPNWDITVGRQYRAIDPPAGLEDLIVRVTLIESGEITCVDDSSERAFVWPSAGSSELITSRLRPASERTRPVLTNQVRQYVDCCGR